MSILDEIQRRGIREVLHFTTNRGLVGTLAVRAVLSRRALPEEDYLEHVLHPNAQVRPEQSVYFDKSEDWLDYVNLSISEINSRFLAVSERWHRDASVWWAILGFDPVILTHDGVYFATTNNAYGACLRGTGSEGFDALFRSPIVRKPAWSAYRGSRAANLATCEQAEALYPTRLPTTYLRTVYVRDAEHLDIVRGFLREFEFEGVDAVLDRAKFAGKPN